MKITDPKLPAAIMDRIMRHPDFAEVSKLVKRNTGGKVYLVGGKVYRTAVELVYGYPCGAEKADWDFLCLGDVVHRQRAYLLPDWHVDYCPYEDYKEHSMCLEYIPPRGPGGFGGPGVIQAYGPKKKIDIIGIKDIPKFNGSEASSSRLNDYFDAVPLTIQAIALSTDSYSYPRLWGAALDSIEAKTIYVNNERGTLRPFDVRQYALQKADSLKFKYHGYRKAGKTPCDCFDGDIGALWRNGCQRKDFHT